MPTWLIAGLWGWLSGSALLIGALVGWYVALPVRLTAAVMSFGSGVLFVGGGVIGGIGVLTLTRIRTKREVLLGSMPLLFAAHQATEGVVWWGLEHKVAHGVLLSASAAYMLYAQALLPTLVPVAILLLETERRRRRWMLSFVILGALFSLYALWALIRFDTDVFERGRSVVYQNPGTEYAPLAVPYVFATCGAMLLSGYRYIVWFGVVNLIGVLAAYLIKASAFTSIWCAYAAFVSALVYGHFHRQRSIEARAKGGD